MSAKADKIGTTTSTPEMFRVGKSFAEPAIFDLSRILLFHELQSVQRPRLWLQLDEAKRTGSASWETLSFAVLCFCAVGGVGLAFL